MGKFITAILAILIILAGALPIIIPLIPTNPNNQTFSSSTFINPLIYQIATMVFGVLILFFTFKKKNPKIRISQR